MIFEIDSGGLNEKKTEKGPEASFVPAIKSIDELNKDEYVISIVAKIGGEKLADNNSVKIRFLSSKYDFKITDESGNELTSSTAIDLNPEIMTSGKKKITFTLIQCLFRFLIFAYNNP